MRNLDYPKFSRDLNDFTVQGPVSLDFEFVGPRITTVGLCAGGTPVSVPFTGGAREFLRELVDGGHHFVGHNFIDADLPLLEDATGRRVPLERIDDTMLGFFLGHADFSGAPNIRKATEDAEDEGTRGVGLLGLGSFASLYTDLPAWKRCRDGLRWGTPWRPSVHCTGPCPIHEEDWYNAVDVYATDRGLPRLQERLDALEIPRDLQERTKRLTAITRRMRDHGVRVDRGYVAQLRRDFEGAKETLFRPCTLTERNPCGVCGRMKKDPPCKVCGEAGTPAGEKGYRSKEVEGYDAPFNPASPKQVLEWFHARGVFLESTEKSEVHGMLDNGVQDDEAAEWLGKLYDWKEIGKGVESWFAEKHFDGDLLHPRFNPTGAGTGRLSSANPNLQNVPKAGGKDSIMARVRRAFVPREGMQLIRADYGQLELRVILWYAYVFLRGKKMPTMGEDLFSEWLPRFGSDLDRLANYMGRKPRDVLKSGVYGGLYMEGLKCLYPSKLREKQRRDEIEAGALVVHRDWTVEDRVVCFTGVNLAKRLFGSATRENRRRALEIQELIWSAIPEVREWHRSLVPHVEARRVRSATGRVLTLYGPVEDRYKVAAAAQGQGGGADVITEAMCRYDEMGETPLIQVHDELIFEAPLDMNVTNVVKYLSVMAEPSDVFPGLQVPIDPKAGPNWLDMVKIA